MPRGNNVECIYKNRLRRLRNCSWYPLAEPSQHGTSPYNVLLLHNRFSCRLREPVNGQLHTFPIATLIIARRIQYPRTRDKGNIRNKAVRFTSQNKIRFRYQRNEPLLTIIQREFPVTKSFMGTIKPRYSEIQSVIKLTEVMVEIRHKTRSFS